VSKPREEIRDGLAQVIREAERFVLPARGVSMGSGFSGVDGLILRGIRHARPGLGSILLFQRADLWVAHRVIARRRGAQGDAFLTRGDANAMFDHPWVEPADLLAQVIGVVRGGADHSFGFADRLAGAWRWMCGVALLGWRLSRRSVKKTSADTRPTG
jgi:hypothetical protein